MQNKFANWIIKNGQWQLIVTKNWILNCIYYDFYHFCSQFKIKTNLNILLWTWFYRDVTMNESMLKRRRRFCWSFFINFAALAVGIVAEKSAKSETNNATVNSNSNVCVCDDDDDQSTVTIQVQGWIYVEKDIWFPFTDIACYKYKCTMCLCAWLRSVCMSKMLCPNNSHKLFLNITLKCKIWINELFQVD